MDAVESEKRAGSDGSRVRSFDRLPPHYRWMEAMLAGSILQRARTRWFDHLSGRRRLLIVGEGPGRTLEVIRRRLPALAVTVVEASGGMIAAAKRRLAKTQIDAENVTWIHADVRSWLAERTVRTNGENEARFDAVLTPFVLDCFSPKDVDAIVAGIARQTSDDALWLLSDFCVPASGWKRWRARWVHGVMYAFFRAATRLDARRLTPPDDALMRAGFALTERALFNAELIHSDVWTTKTPRVGGALTRTKSREFS